MSEMVERVARAIYQAAVKPPNLEYFKWENMQPQSRSQYIDAAQAAIKEMLKPTEAMVELFDDEDRRFATYCWDAFVTEALK